MNLGTVEVDVTIRLSILINLALIDQWEEILVGTVLEAGFGTAAGGIIWTSIVRIMGSVIRTRRALHCAMAKAAKPRTDRMEIRCMMLAEDKLVKLAQFKGGNLRGGNRRKILS